MANKTTGQDNDTAESHESTTFSIAGARKGFLACVPVALGVAGYGVLFGVLARQAGLSVAESTLMSATVLAGAAQVIAIGVWDQPIPILVVIGTTFIVNLRYLLMGASLRPWFEDLSPLQAYGSVFFTADENWALTIQELRSGNSTGAFLLGSGIAIWVFWVLATVLGAVAGGVIDDPATYGLDFMLTAVFITIAVSLWEGQSDLVPWLVAGVVAVGTAQLFGGQWYILFGGLAGAGVELIRYDRGADSVQ
jgi:4-azaleucine resistance transporter AzlC